MTEKFKILAQYIKDISSETPNIETYIFVKNNISQYQEFHWINLLYNFPKF